MSNNSYPGTLIMRIKIQTFRQMFSTYIHKKAKLHGRAPDCKYSCQVFMMKNSMSNGKERCYLPPNNYNGAK